MSPTSSRKIVPPSASTNFPVCLRSAPVNEPRSWPKSSDSMSLSGMAAQLTCTNGPAFTSEPSWIARATSSLPVPLGPTMRTVAGVGAAFATSARSLRIASLVPTIRVMPRRDFSSRFSRARRVESRTRRSAFRTCSDESGFSRKSSAPACTASIAVFTSPWPEMMIDGRRDPARAELRERLEAVLAGHLDVEEHGVVVGRLGDGVRARGDGRDLVSLLREERPEGLADVGFVVADEDAARHPCDPSSPTRGRAAPRRAPSAVSLDAPCESFGDTKRKRFFE